MNIRQFLTSENITHETIRHRATFDAARLAQAVDEPGDFVAKTVVVKADGEYVLTVLPASHNLDIPTARETLGCSELEIAIEDELAPLFPDCELGAIPPFGSLYGIKTWVDSRLTEDDHIVFETNAHDEAIRMSYASYERVEEPLVGELSSHR